MSAMWLLGSLEFCSRLRKLGPWRWSIIPCMRPHREPPIWEFLSEELKFFDQGESGRYTSFAGMTR